MLCLRAILTNSNHQYNGMEGTKGNKYVLGLNYYMRNATE